VTQTNWPGIDNFTELQDGATCMGRRTFAAQFVEAVAQPMAFVTIFFREAACVEMSATWAMFVNHTTIGKLGAAKFVEFWQLAERYILQQSAEQDIRIRRTAWKGNHRLPFQQLTDA
jgi:hypothetical protein